MVELINIEKKFGEKVLFQNFNEIIKDNEFVVFSGKSGCGKTTLLNIIGGIESIDDGKILVDGIDVTKKKNLLNYFRDKVGFLFQNFALVENKTVKENLRLVRKESRTQVTIEEALQSVGLEDKLNHKIYTLSGGEQQRIALARLMIKRCSIILADEPTGSLDRENTDIVLEILEKNHQQGKTIIVVTHDEHVKERGERVIEL
ncbi:MAG: ATP-binding cassette domain-containing protein [Dorea sp.]|jgi:putative ABC transport system ATP-binding protein|nr:ATP-binding cassette domain-containing protein [Dorea sp.]